MHCPPPAPQLDGEGGGRLSRQPDQVQKYAVERLVTTCHKVGRAEIPHTWLLADQMAMFCATDGEEAVIKT